MSPRISPKSWADQMVQEDMERKEKEDKNKAVAKNIGQKGMVISRAICSKFCDL